MLQHLSIKNIALIDSAEIDFTDGLNVMSGETGSGKSVILESLNFVLGAKSDKTLIRSGEDECFVKAEFFIEDNKEIENVLKELDIDFDNTIIISRKLTIDGKSNIKVNGVTLSSSMLRQLTQLLVDVHGQSEHFYLLKTSNQLDLIDKFGGENLLTIKGNCHNLYNEYKNILSELNNLGGDENQRLMKLDILNFQINEIENCDLKENEEQDLLDKKKKFQNLDKINSALESIKQAISAEGSSIDSLSMANKELSTITKLSEEYNSLYDRLTSSIAEIEDISDTAEKYIDDLDIGDIDIEKIENRLEQIKTIKKKYGNNYQEIQLFLENAKNEKNKLENFNVLAEKLLKNKDKVKIDLYNSNKQLSELRKNIAKDFSKKVLKELVELGISKAQFDVKFDIEPDIDTFEPNSSNGFDNIEFLFSANLGEPLKPLSSIISGGEMSRFMLAIKSQTAKYNNIGTFIFDEIDSGISGVIAKVVGEKFAKIALNTQIIAISHLPQISVMADNNLLISKHENGNKTNTIVEILNEETKISEIVRLIGGDMNSLSAVNHAKEMIDSAKKYKNSIK